MLYIIRIAALFSSRLEPAPPADGLRAQTEHIEDFPPLAAPVMADRDIPSVPVTTLAGLASLSDRKCFVCDVHNDAQILPQRTTTTSSSSNDMYLDFSARCAVLSELPICESSVITSLHKSLLFHPRVAEEANNLLSLKDDTLTRQLVHALEQTSADHM